MSDLKMSDVLMAAVELVLSRSGDIDLEDGSFATCGTDEIIRLDTSIAGFLDLPSDDVDIRDIDLIFYKSKSYDANQELIAKQAETIKQQAAKIESIQGELNAAPCKERNKYLVKMSKLQADNELLRDALESMSHVLSGYEKPPAEVKAAIYNMDKALAATAKG